MQCLGFIWFPILNLSTTHPLLHHSLVMCCPKYIGIRLHFREFSKRHQGYLTYFQQLYDWKHQQWEREVPCSRPTGPDACFPPNLPGPPRQPLPLVPEAPTQPRGSWYDTGEEAGGGRQETGGECYRRRCKIYTEKVPCTVLGSCRWSRAGTPLICTLHRDAEGTGLARDRIICKLCFNVLFEYRDTGQNGQWMVYIGWWAPAIEPVTGFLAMHMLKKISENEGMRRSYQSMVTAWLECANTGIRRAVGGLISSFDINDYFDFQK